MSKMYTRTGALVLLALFTGEPQAQAAPDRSLAEQVNQLAKKLREAMSSDPKLKEKKLKIGLFSGPQLPNTNFGQGIRRQLAQTLKEVVADKAELTLLGRYDYVEADNDTAGDDRTYKLQIIRITAVIEDRAARELVKYSEEVNNTEDIERALGVTDAPPLHGAQSERNKQARKAHENPDFQVLDRTRIAPVQFDKNRTPFSVEILVKNALRGKPIPAAPQKLNGRAFVDVKPSQFYEIRLHNDGEFTGAAEVTIDGLSATSTFNKDEAKPRYYLIPAKGATTIRGWLHTTKPGAKDNVLSFQVTEYGRGAATQFKSSGEVGVITVRFSAAWKEGDKPPESETGARSARRETKPGPGLPENLKVVKRHIGLVRSTISVRYSPTGK